MISCRAIFHFVCLLLISCDNLYKDPIGKQINRCDFKCFTEPIFEPVFLDDPEEETYEAPKYSKNFYKNISCNVTTDMPINDVIINLAKQADISACISNNVSGKITLFVQNKKFIELLDDICDTCNLRYKINGNSITVENDTPYLETYDLQFLNISRESKGEIATANDVFSNMDMSQDSHGNNVKNNKIDNGSNSSLKGTGKNDFWAELEASIKTIIEAKSDKSSDISIHKQGGLISVIANSKKQKAIKKYIDKLKKTTETQVLIEAKILEVSLKDEYRGGINWYSKDNGMFPISMKFGDELSNSSQLTAFSVGANNSTNFNAIIKFIEKFGSVKTLSNPRITVMNNQSAILKVARNEVITKLSIYRQFSSNNDSRNSDSLYTDIQTIPIGLIFTVQPAIDSKTKNIILTLRPTLSRVVNFKKVPSYIYVSGKENKANNLNNNLTMMDIPIVEVRELDSVLNVKSGQVIVLGGLMQEKAKNEKIGIPGLSKSPIMKDLFGASSKDSEVTELIIFLRARVIDKKRKNNVHPKDADYLKNYTNDTRPIL